MICCLFILIPSKVFLNFTLLTSQRSVMFNIYVCVYFLGLLVVAAAVNFQLYLVVVINDIRCIFNLFRFVLWSSIWYILENVLCTDCTVEKDVQNPMFFRCILSPFGLQCRLPVILLLSLLMMKWDETGCWSCLLLLCYSFSLSLD